MRSLTERERESIGRAIYEGRFEQHAVKAWTELPDCEREWWRRSADKAWAHMHVVSGVRIATGKAA